MTNLKKINSFENFIYDKLAPFVEQVPTDIVSACQLGLSKLKEQREEKFISDVLNDLKAIGIKELKTEQFLSRLYLTSLVIAKAQTHDKYIRFKSLIVNSTIFKISDDEYELYKDIIESISDIEFLILKYLRDITIPDGKDKDIQTFYDITGLNKQKIKSHLQRLESYGLAEQEMLVNIIYKPVECFSRPVLEIEADSYPNKKLSRYYTISRLGELFLNFIALDSLSTINQG